MAGEPPGNSSDESAVQDLHVLQVADCDIFDRFGQMLRHAALALNAEGLHVSLLTDDPVAVADLEGTPVECFWSRVLSGWLPWRQDHQLSQRFDPPPNIVHLWGTTALRSVGEWARRNGISVLVHALSTADVERLSRRGVRKRVHVALGCQGLLGLLEARAAMLSAHAQVCPPALLTPETRSDENRADGLTLGVIWAGRFAEDAGLEPLLDAIARLRAKNYDLQVALVGAGPAARATQAQIRAAGVQDCVSLIDEPDLWEKALAGADVCVVPARQADLSLAPLLAMAMGKVVIASRDQIAEWFIEDQTAWQFTPGSAVELAYHLTRVADGDRHAVGLRQSAAAYVRQHHAISRLSADLLAIYRRAAQADNGRQ